MPSMDSSTASPRHPDPDAVEFVRFCYRRRRVGWPELYDEMCGVAARGLFRGFGPDELAGLGIGFSLFDMPALAVLSASVIAEEQSRRRPVAVAIIAEEPPLVLESAPEPQPVGAAVAGGGRPRGCRGAFDADRTPGGANGGALHRCPDPPRDGARRSVATPGVRAGRPRPS